MSEADPKFQRARVTFTNQQKRIRAEETHQTAMATIAAETDARRQQTARLRSAREAASRSAGSKSAN